MDHLVNHLEWDAEMGITGSFGIKVQGLQETSGDGEHGVSHHFFKGHAVVAPRDETGLIGAARRHRDQ